MMRKWRLSFRKMIIYARKHYLDTESLEMCVWYVMMHMGCCLVCDVDVWYVMWTYKGSMVRYTGRNCPCTGVTLDKMVHVWYVTLDKMVYVWYVTLDKMVLVWYVMLTCMVCDAGQKI